MEDLKKEIIQHTHCGLKIYAHILRNYFPGEIVIKHYGPKPILTKNPFRNNRTSLYLEKADNQYLYFDAEESNFKGDVFDFAQHHFQQDGDDLLKQIISALNLEYMLTHHLGDDFVNWLGNKKMIPTFSYFNRPVSNVYPAHTKSILDIYNIIKGSNLLNETNRLRSIPEKKEARKFKAYNFDYVTFSGIFSSRRDQALISHSGLLTIDFDNIPNVPELRTNLLNDQYFQTELLFTSPSGNGIKWIIPIDIKQATHQEYFRAVANYIQQTYKTEVDQSGKDVSRACFLVHDENVFINPNYLEDVKKH